MDKLEEIRETGRMYDKMLNTIRKKNPINDVKRVVEAEAYLKNIILGYKPKRGELKSHLMRGACGEVMFEIVSNYYRNYYPNFITFKNLVLPMEDGGTTQLDFVLLSPRGLIVIEVKSIFGNIEVEQEFVMSEYKDHKGEWQQSEMKPWNQNMMHIIALKKYLNESNLFFHNAVFFFSAGDIVKANPKEGNVLMTLSNVMHQIDDLMNNKRNGREIPKDIMARIIEKMEKTIPTVEKELEHVRNVQKKYGYS